MESKHKDKKWCRYADDGVIHCKTESSAKELLIELRERFARYKLEMHTEKTKIIYCKDGKRKGDHSNTKFTFLGYEFRRRTTKCQDGRIFLSFNPAISREAKKDISRKIRKTGVQNRSDLSLAQVAERLNPMLNGWINYYGRFNKSAMNPVMRQINFTLIKWCTRKYKRFRCSRVKASLYMTNMSKRQPYLFAHWKQGVLDTFV